MSDSFAPGPWRLDYCGKCGVWEVVAANGQPVLCSHYVGDNYDGDNYGAVSEKGNAVLIAASPNMFDFIARKAREGDQEAALIVRGILASAT